MRHGLYLYGPIVPGLTHCHKIVGFAQLWTNGSLVLHSCMLHISATTQPAHNIHPCYMLQHFWLARYKSLSLSAPRALLLTPKRGPTNRSAWSSPHCCYCSVCFLSLAIPFLSVCRLTSLCKAACCWSFYGYADF
jgi:hypothetical protein